MDSEHDHEDGHAHHPGTQKDVRLSYHARRILAIRELLVEKGILGPDEVQQAIESFERRSPADGARVVARAWADSDFKRRLLSDPHGALAEMGYSLPPETPRLALVENTERVRYLVVCTLCSCYPRQLLGAPPDWYKSLAYRSRAVRDPRAVMREFGTHVSDDVEVRVVDSTADLRYMVLPLRPTGTERMGEEELAKLVTRDSMIGVSDPLSPAMTSPGP